MLRGLALGTHDHKVVALHEAAHVVVGEHFGKKLVETSLEDTPGRPGYTRMEWGPEVNQEWRRSKDMVICTAGPIVDQVFVERIDIGDTDFEQLRLALDILDVPESELAELLPRLLEEAATVIVQRIEEFVEVARLLIEHKKLTRDELLAKSKVQLFSQP